MRRAVLGAGISIAALAALLLTAGGGGSRAEAAGYAPGYSLGAVTPAADIYNCNGFLVSNGTISVTNAYGAYPLNGYTITGNTIYMTDPYGNLVPVSGLGMPNGSIYTVDQYGNLVPTLYNPALLNTSGCVQACLSPTPQLDCSGPPASFSIQASPSQVSCGSMSNVSVPIFSAFGIGVADMTPVNFTTTLGTITNTVNTYGGIAVANLSIPPKTTGTAHITVSVNGLVGSKDITVTC
jgi:hypothetical protein